MGKECAFCGKSYTPDLRNRRKSKYCPDSDCRRKHWRQLNPEKERAQQLRAVANRKNDPERYALWKATAKVRNQTLSGRYIHCRAGANSRKIPFLLTKEEFSTFWQKDCHYCGDSIETVGIDRVNNLQGYSIENCVSCCLDCNKMKMEKTVEGFLKKCEIISKRSKYLCQSQSNSLATP